MAPEIISTPDAPGGASYDSFPYSQAVKAAGLVFGAGQGLLDPASGAVVGATIQEQTAQSRRSRSLPAARWRRS